MNSPFPKSSSAPGEGRLVVKLLPNGTSGLENITYQYPLKLITPSKPSENESVLVFLLSYGGGLIGGDSVHLSIDVQPNAKLSILTQGHTKIFNSSSRDIVTRQTLAVQIADGAALCLLPDPVQPFEDSVYEQTQVFKLAMRGSLCLLDWVTQGRTARGENWSLTRWVGRNEVWVPDQARPNGERLLVRDTVILDAERPQSEMPGLRESMSRMGSFGTLLLRGPLVKALGEFFLAEFAALPQIGARDFRSDEARLADVEELSPLEKWRTERTRMEKEKGLLWSAANVRGCVVVKFGAPDVEAGRDWIGSMLLQEGSIAEIFGNQALIRAPLMETSDNNATGSPTPTGTSRRSGRVLKAPEKFIPDAPAAAKRKRHDDNDDDDAENDAPLTDLEDSDADVDDAADDDEDATEEAPKRKKKPSQSAWSRKPAAKKPKTNGDAGGHPAKSLASRPKKVVRTAPVEPHDGDGLFAEIFTTGHSSNDVASDWYTRYQADNAAALTDLVNCILLSAGCHQLVTEDDIRDPENCQNRLADLQNVYTEAGITEYPLVSRTRGTKSFRDLLVSFFRSLLNVLHEVGAMYKDDDLMENLHRWVASMSSSTLRPFRHTATTVALAMETALVEVAKKLDDRVTKLTQQAESERGRNGKNKGRLAAIERDLAEANDNREICTEKISDFFDTVFVHRYRDIDPKIRTECVDALGSWILLLPSTFMEPGYLRYLGWMLSDVFPATRQEVLKQVARIFKRDADKLGHFIDRFRERLVEMATRDADASVRVAAISVIETLKSTGMLEPNEIDAIGKLIFDSEIRVRRAVVDFFVGCVNDSIESKMEEMGGDDAIEEIFGKDNEEEYNAPRRDWISIKCLVEMIAIYDAQFEEEQAIVPPKPLDIAVDLYNGSVPETRIAMAAQVLYEKIDHIRDWEVLAGYLLYDHTTSAKSSKSSKSKASKNEQALKGAVAPEGQEEVILLEILCSAVQLSLSQSAELKKKPRLETDAQDEIGVNLATLIPTLLKKFGAEPTTATLVLRLEHSLDLDVFQQLRQDATTYTRLLDEICTQFNRHVDRAVISEAARSLLHAREYEELAELAESRISVLWENLLDSLRNFDKSGELSIRGDLDAELLADLGTVLMKIGQLASVAPCIDVLSASGQDEDSSSPPIEILVRIVHRGKIETVDENLDDLEDEAVAYAIKASKFYFLWNAYSLISAVNTGASISGDDIHRLDLVRQTYRDNLIDTLSSRASNDDLRMFSTGALCDLVVTLASVRATVDQTPNAAQKYPGLDVLFEEIDPRLVDAELLEIFDSAERAYARRAKKTLNEPADDEDPMDDDEDEDDADDEGLSDEDLKWKELKAEKSLCELTSKYVLAILANMLDHGGPTPGKLRRRMKRNANKLGPMFKEAVSYLDEEKLKEVIMGAPKKSKKRSKKPAAGGGGGEKKKARSEEVVIDDDSDEDPFEEGTVEDLRRKELLDEEPLDEVQRPETPVENDEEDSVLGD
ncbi:UreD urease accessory protein-domain-containing protein [Coniochaeta sp. 2T2.1]|nr:UreD urease accessory protein-domain-containing protein [Coniochaeta sp. 2T2.1]